MNYKAQLLKEHSRSNTDRIAKAIGTDPSEFQKIIAIIYTEKAQLPQRASWLLSVVNDSHPELLKPYLSKFVNDIQKFKTDAIKRNMMNVLSFHKIPKRSHGKLIDVCFSCMLSPNESVVVKVHAMQTIANLCKEYPELINELKAAIEDQLPKTTAAFSARARHVLKRI